MAGIKDITMKELYEMKFDIIEHFGMARNGQFFIMNTVEPIQYGSDCKDYTWICVQVKGEQLPSLGEFIHSLFGNVIDVSNMKAAFSSINNLDKEYHETIPSVDWGACQVTHIPFADRFRKVGVING